MKLRIQELNTVYHQLQAIYPNPDLLKSSKKSWIKFRDAECAMLAGSPSGVTMGGNWASADYAIKMTNERIKVLKHLVEYGPSVGTAGGYLEDGC